MFYCTASEVKKMNAKKWSVRLVARNMNIWLVCPLGIHIPDGTPAPVQHRRCIHSTATDRQYADKNGMIYSVCICVCVRKCNALIKLCGENEFEERFGFQEIHMHCHFLLQHPCDAAAGSKNKNSAIT